MSMRQLPISALAAAMLVVAAASPAADEKPMPQMQHMPVDSIDQQAGSAESKADHEAVAERFEQEAADFEKRAAEHERLAQRYRKGQGVGPKGNALNMAIHCESLVKNLRASASDAREMARLHRAVAEQISK